MRDLLLALLLLQGPAATQIICYRQGRGDREMVNVQFSIFNSHPSGSDENWELNIDHFPNSPGLLVPHRLRIFLHNKIDQMDHRDRLESRGAFIHGDAALLQ
jgi:hypothetical protein